MTADELIQLGNDRPVLYKGVGVVVFECLSMRLIPGATRKQPMKATIRFPNGRVSTVPTSRLSLVDPDDSEG